MVLFVVQETAGVCELNQIVNENAPVLTVVGEYI